MGNKEEKWTQCVTLAVLLMMVMTVEGTDPVCRPFCHLPPETHEKCSSLRFLFSCISKVKMRYNSEKSFIKLHLFYKSGFFLKKKFKTKLNCGNAVTNVKHLTHVNYIPQIYVLKLYLCIILFIYKMYNEPSLFLWMAARTGKCLFGVGETGKSPEFQHFWAVYRHSYRRLWWVYPASQYNFTTGIQTLNFEKKDTL